MRIDLWIILVVLAAVKSPEHIVVGIALGLLNLFHHSLGLVYSVSYALFVVASPLALEGSVREVAASVRRHAPNLGLMVIGEVCHRFLSSSPDPATMYRSLGIGFLRIS